MKIAIDLGHGCAFDGGAMAIVKEETFIDDTGKLLIEKLKIQGNQIILTRPKSASSTKNSLVQRCDIANYHDCDLFISLHFNAFTPKANGTEVLAIGKVGCKYASSVVKNIAQLGYVNRGVKDGSHLYVLRNTQMPALLIEGCFISNSSDVAIFNAEKMSEAIARGILSVNTGDE
jgi:N-acetylmuramoyl-L-alanine amidase